LATYSFQDVNAALTDDIASFDLGSESGVAEEGITIAMEGDKGTIVWGADGTPMHSLHAAQGGTVSIRLQKTSPINYKLAQFYTQSTASSANYGNATITVRNATRGDSIVCLLCGIKKSPDVVYAKEGGFMDWVFNAGQIAEILGDGNPNNTTILAA
jgi:hypothetical protein